MIGTYFHSVPFLISNGKLLQFEVFVDTEGSNHNYKEVRWCNACYLVSWPISLLQPDVYIQFEINALGTTWSLLLNKPYADNGGENSKRVDADGEPAKCVILFHVKMPIPTRYRHFLHVDGLLGYDMGPHLQSAVKVYPDGAINQPTIKNICWTVEIAFPISKLMERNSLAKRPVNNVFWRINFSRVQWGWKLNEEGQYEKEPCCQTCATPGSAAEDNWVWSKQGEVAMHLPEKWGILQFEANRQSDGKMRYYDEWPCRCAAMAMYYAMKKYHETEGKYTTNVEDLKPHANSHFPICDEAEMSISLTNSGYEARASIASYSASVNEERYLVVLPDKLTSDTGSAVTE